MHIEKAKRHGMTDPIDYNKYTLHYIADLGMLLGLLYSKRIKRIGLGKWVDLVYENVYEELSNYWGE